MKIWHYNPEGVLYFSKKLSHPFGIVQLTR
jgi:hypothetical protein